MAKFRSVVKAYDGNNKKVVTIDGGEDIIQATGFEFDNERFKLNPSYSPLFIYQQFKKLYPHSPWHQLHEGSAKLILDTAKQGASPDWVMFDANNGFYYDKKTSDLGSYNAIRVYLWASMMADDAPYKKELLAQFNPFIETINKRGYVP